MIFHGRVPEAMRVRGLRVRLNPLQSRQIRRKSQAPQPRTMAKTKLTPRRMRRRNPQSNRAPVREPGRTDIITTIPDDIFAIKEWLSAGSASRRAKLHRIQWSGRADEVIEWGAMSA
jgi:hypothetical protein